MKIKFLILLSISLLFIFACDDGIKFDNPNDEKNKAAVQQGELGGECYPNKTCNEGLICDKESNSCIEESGTTNDDDGTDTTSENDEDEPVSDDSDSTPDEADSTDDSSDSVQDESDSDDDSANSVSDDDSDSTDTTPDNSDSDPDENTDSGNSTPDEDIDLEEPDEIVIPDNDQIDPSTPCNPNPCSSIANSTGSCTVNGTTYSCGCNANYNWNGSECKNGGMLNLPECSASSETPCYDSTSRLTWSKKADSTMTYSSAKSYCGTYSEGGLHGWHLPNIDELKTLLIWSRADSCKVSEENNCLSWDACWSCGTCTETGTQSTSGYMCSNGYGTSYGDGRYSKLGDNGKFWSSSVRSDKNYFWSIDFSIGFIGYNSSSYSTNFRCVIN